MINIAVYVIFHFSLLRNKSHRLDMSLKWRKDTELFEMHCHDFINVVILLLSSTKESRLYWWHLSCFLSPPPEGSLSDSSAQPSSAPGSLNNSTWASILQSPFLLFFFSSFHFFLPRPLNFPPGSRTFKIKMTDHTHRNTRRCWLFPLPPPSLKRQKTKWCSKENDFCGWELEEVALLR